MKKLDYIIVGDGFGALFFAHQLIKNGKSFQLFSEGEKGASRVSAGLVNPVVLKKFTTFDRAMEQIESLHQSLEEIAQYTGVNYFIHEPIHRIFHDEKERLLWKSKAQNPSLAPFLSLDDITLEGIANPYGVGKVTHSGRIDVEAFFKGLTTALKDRQVLKEERFDYQALDASAGRYKELAFSHVVFAEGMGVRENPFFKDLPVIPNKGHRLTLTLPSGGNLTHVVKKKHFLFPLSKQQFYYGGTYDRHSETNEIDPVAIEQLKRGLEEFYSGPVENLDAQFGFRPTVRDRRPILGASAKFPNLFVFNGLGARGVLNGNFYAPFLFKHIETQSALPMEVDLKRFNF